MYLSINTERVSLSYIYDVFFKQISRFFLFVAPIFIYLPSIGQSSVVTSGNDIENVNGSVSCTIGSVFYHGRVQKLTITEGLQQSYVINEIPSKSTLRVALFPNPTSDLVFFKVENLNYKNLSYRIYDLTGRLLSEGKIINPQSSISIQSFSSNIFIVRVFRNAVEEKSFKVVKVN